MTHPSSRRGSEVSDVQSVRSMSSRSNFGEGPVMRSRTWSEDVTKTWNEPAAMGESVKQRADRYRLYFQFNEEQLKSIHARMLNELRQGLNVHREAPRAPWNKGVCSLKMLDTCITDLPKGTEKGAAYALDFGGGNDGGVAHAVRVKLEGNNHCSTSVQPIPLREVSEFGKGLLDAKAPAQKLFDTLAHGVKDLMEKQGDLHAKHLDLGFSLGFPAEQKGHKSATLIHWVKGFQTGRATKDPVEGTDVGALLDCALSRAKLAVRTSAVVADVAAMLVAANYEKPAKLPECRAAIVIGVGVNGCLCLPPNDAKNFGYKGMVVNCELGSFDSGLPINDVDLEVDFADNGARSLQCFEKMVAAGYLGEVCRRLVVKVWQNEAPELAWVRRSMPWTACSRVIVDRTDALSDVDMVLKGLWDWTTNVHERRTVQQLFELVFDRSAALAAVAVAALAKMTGRLQPAMGGLTCAIDGALYTESPLYAQRVSYHLDTILGEDVAGLIKFCICRDGGVKGAAWLAMMSGRK